MEIIKGEVYHFGTLYWRVLDVKKDKALFITEDIEYFDAYHETGEAPAAEFQYDSYNCEVWEVGEQSAEDKANAVTWEVCTLRKWLNGEFLCHRGHFDEQDIDAIVETLLENKDNPHYNTNGGNPTKDKVFLLSMEEAKKYFRLNRDRVAYNDVEGEDWWLRTPGDSYGRMRSTACVTDKGSIGKACRHVSTKCGVRPAVWLNYHDAHIETLLERQKLLERLLK